MMDSVRRHLGVVLIVILCLVQTMAQDCPYSDPRCSCGRDVTCYELDTIPALNTGANVTEVTSITFQGGNITSISRSSLPPGLTKIKIRGNPLTNISDDAFDASVATLQTVFIKGAEFSNLPKALKKLTNLTELIIIDTPIQDWDIATLTQLGTTLKLLSLSNVTHSSWPTWISDFRLLHTLDLSLNPLSSVPDDAFLFVKDTLLVLDLSGTGLTHVPKALSSLSNVTYLSLVNNNFTDVSEFQYITASTFADKLTYLNLQSVGLTLMLNISNLTNLKMVDFSNNRIADVPAASFPLSLTYVGFGNNSLSSVPPDLANMPNVSALILKYNVISEIEPNALPSSLTFLTLEDNNLTAITNTTFKNLNLLRTLYLSNNPIATISPEAFSDLVSLSTLIIFRAHLTEIPLAVTRLNPNTRLEITNTKPVSCPCPALQELVQWATSFSFFNNFVVVKCDNGQYVHDYLKGQCGQSSSTA